MFAQKDKKYILLVDNFQQVCKVTQSVLEKAGYSVISVSNVRDALKIMLRKRPDMIISEIELPEIDGIHFYSKLKKGKETRNIPFVFMTSHDMNKLKPLSTVTKKYYDLIIAKPIQWKTALEQIGKMLQIREKMAAKAISKAPPSNKAAQSQTNQSQITNNQQQPQSNGRIKTSEMKITKTSSTTPNQPKILEMRESSTFILKRKKKPSSPTSNNPSWQSTKNFSAPIWTFGTKELGGKGFVSHIFSYLKKGKKVENSPLQFQPIQFEQSGLRAQIQQRIVQKNIIEEDILNDLDVEEVPNSYYTVSKSTNAIPPASIEIEPDLIEEVTESQSDDTTEEVQISDVIHTSKQQKAMQIELLEETPNTSNEKISDTTQNENKSEAISQKELTQSLNSDELKITDQSDKLVDNQIKNEERLELADKKFEPTTTEPISKIADESSSELPNIFKNFPHLTEYQIQNFSKSYQNSNMKVPMSDQQFAFLSESVFVVGTAGLQIFSLECKATEVLLECEQEQIIWIQDDAQEIWAMGIAPLKKFC